MTEDYLKFASPLLDEATIAGVGDVLRSGHIASGPWVQKFEAELSAFCGGRPVRTFNSGTATLEIGLRIAGVGAGDEVITTPATWVSTRTASCSRPSITASVTARRSARSCSTSPPTSRWRSRATTSW